MRSGAKSSTGPESLACQRPKIKTSLRDNTVWKSARENGSVNRNNRTSNSVAFSAPLSGGNANSRVAKMETSRESFPNRNPAQIVDVP